ncbi:hypothetical protein CBR_g29376 [Chara braunii]|uniref:RNA-directed DNA polymerase n=1 Tax=Chara braunii TaxID=69332 RepID=A0A388JWN0_CHABU|nr:hypothetical protein CBR_g29376 [Chara braunii]|eukprot:GBG62177.1 hypothetical protein CBR_g29376 [Chara braunii]
MPRQGQRRRSLMAKLGKLSSVGSEATPLPISLDTVASLATSHMFREHADVARLWDDFEDYAVQLVPPLDLPLRVQDTHVWAVSSPSAREPASSPTLSSGDSSVWSRLEDLDTLTTEDYQWLPLPPSGSLPKPHCNALMAELQRYLHTAVPAPLTDDGVAVVDRREYIVKIGREYATQRYDNIDAPLLYICIQIGKAACSALIDCGATRNYISQDFMAHANLGPHVRRKSQPTQATLVDGHTHKSIDRCIDVVLVYFALQACKTVSFDILDTKFDTISGMLWLRSEDHPVNFYRHTIPVCDRNGILVPCTVPSSHPSIGCHVVSAASIHNSITRQDVEEMGICFLHALPPPDKPTMEVPPDPRVVTLLDSFDDVFEAPARIVSDRPIRHKIILEDRAVRMLRTTKYKANRAKCKFAQQELEYLGHFVMPQGIRPLVDKINVIQDWSKLTNITKVRSFMGLATSPTRVTANTSGYGIGAVLEQHDGVDWHQVEYFSRKVPPINSIDDARKELLAFVTVLKRWQHFLLGRRRFTWATDSNPSAYYKTLDMAVDIDAPCSPASVPKYWDLLAQARANMQKAQVRLQQQANRRRMPCPIRAGDLVWVSGEEFALEQDVSPKLLPKWFGHWTVTFAAGDEPDGPSFVIEISSHLTVHPFFRGSKLATYTPAKSVQFPDRRSQDHPSMDGHQEIDRVVTHRKYGNKPMQYKVTFK